MHHFGNTSNFEHHCRPNQQVAHHEHQGVYSDSKLAMNLLSIELQRRLDDANVKPNGHRARSVAVNPGAVASDIWRGVPWAVRTFLLDPIMALLFLNTDEGCATSFHGATQPLTDDTPHYFAPYWVPSVGGLSVSLPFEFVGPFVGVRQVPQTLPADESRAASSLWQLASQSISEIEQRAHKTDAPSSATPEDKRLLD
jgi:hypothetical protein